MNSKNSKITVDINATDAIKPKNSNNYKYLTGNLIFQRAGSEVRILDGKVEIDADILGVDKIYFRAENGHITISNRFRDFKKGKVNKKFMEQQLMKGYIPYPYTIIEGVMKAPPGLITTICFENGAMKLSYRPSKQIGIFNKNTIKNRFDKKLFRNQLSKLLHANYGKKDITSSFSGGFDSLFLTEFYKPQCKDIVHYSQDELIQIDHYKKIFPGKNWFVVGNDAEFSEADRKRYFEAIDEPGCDPSGFAEYVMLKEYLRKSRRKSATIMNGQACDGIFGNGLNYFHEHIAQIVPGAIRKSGIIDKIDSEHPILLRLHNYTVDTKRRFVKYYFYNYRRDRHMYPEFDRIYATYESSIKNEPANFLAAISMMMRYSVYGIEKIKTASRALGIKYYLPFMSTNIIEYAFSIPAKEKVGFRMGKKIIRKAFPEITTMKFMSRDFIPQKLKERFIGESITEEKYKKYYFTNWIKYNKKNNRLD